MTFDRIDMFVVICLSAVSMNFPPYFFFSAHIDAVITNSLGKF